VTRRLLHRVRRELAKPPGEARLDRRDVRALVRLAERLLRLGPYVRHHPDCAVTRGSEWEKRCTCGLEHLYTNRP